MVLKTLIRRADKRPRHLEAPLLAEREQFLSSLIQQGTSDDQVRAIAAELLNVIRLMNLNELRMVAASEIKDSAQHWLLDKQVSRPSPPTGNAAAKFIRAATKFLGFHHMILPSADGRQPFGGVMPKYAAFLEGRICKETRRSYLRIVRNFLSSAEEQHGSLATLTLVDVKRYLDSQRLAGNNPGTIAAHCQAIRTFLRYCEGNEVGLLLRADQVPSPRVRRYDPNPRGPSWRDVRRLLNSGCKENVADIRARAILFLCSIYAMRACEVSNLKLTDFDWAGEVFTLRRAKGGPVQRFPIQFEAGEAILNYIRYARPDCSCRSLFVTLNPPYRPVLTHTVCVVVVARMKRLKIKAVSIGPHSLRHSCATQLLSTGASVREIADFLGHTHLRSVSIYAKCSLHALRAVAEFPLDVLT